MSEKEIINKTPIHSSSAYSSMQYESEGSAISPPPLQLSSHPIQMQTPEEEELHTWGRHPNEQPGPYAHMSYSDQGNVQAGFGLLHQEFENGGQIDGMNANIIAGEFGEEGSTRWGIKGDAQMMNMTSGNNGILNNWVGGEMSVFNAGAEASAGQDGATLGATAGVVGGALRVGNSDATHARDEQARFGLGFGVGGAGRLHWGDSDKDGYREYGAGVDIGPFTADIKTEDPAMTYLKSNPITMMSAHALNFLADDDFNLTESMGDSASSAWEELKSWF